MTLNIIFSVVTDEPIEFEKQTVEVQDLKKITDHFRESYGIYLNLLKKIRKIITRNRLELGTLGFDRLCPKIFLDIDRESLSLPCSCYYIQKLVNVEGSSH